MIVYLDASALVKCYVSEQSSRAVLSLMKKASAVGTAAISRAEVSAAVSKAIRMKVLTQSEASSALQSATEDWENLMRLQITEGLIARASVLAWSHGLMGYDAVHLAAAVFWQEMLGEDVCLATYNPQLWQAAVNINGIIAWPASL